MWHEQNFWDRILSTDNTPDLLDPIKMRAAASKTSEDWLRVCSDLALFMKDVLRTPPEDFDWDAELDRLNSILDRRADLPPQEAIGMAEAFAEHPATPREGVSMLLGNFLYHLYKKFGFDFNSWKRNQDDNNNDQDEEQVSDE